MSNKKGPDHIIVDGSNIATEGRSMPSLTQLSEAVNSFMEEHPETVRQRQGRDVGVEVGVAFCEFVKRRDELFVDDQSVATGMGGDDRDAFIQGEWQSVRIAG